MKLSNSLLAGAVVATAFLFAGCQADKTEVTGPPVDGEIQNAESKAVTTGNPTKLLWGDTHLHTLNSADAVSFGARLSPADAYKFARGDDVTSHTGQKVQLKRPLDFLVSTF